MPQPLQRCSPHSLAILPITLSTSLSLIAILSYLQLLYATSFLLRLLRRPRYNSTPLRETISQTERNTVDILFHIVPVSLYRSPPASGLLHEDPLGHRIASAARSSEPVSHFRSHSHFSHASSVTEVSDDRLQCYPSNAIERMCPHVQYTPALYKPGQYEQKENGNNITIPYEATKPAPQRSRPPIPGMTDQQAASTQQVIRTDRTKLSQHSEETQVPETGDTQASEPVPDMPDTVQPVEESPKVSLDKHSECGMCSVSTKSTDSFSLPLTRSHKRRSMESYPGRYPVSDGLNLSIWLRRRMPSVSGGRFSCGLFRTTDAVCWVESAVGVWRLGEAVYTFLPLLILVAFVPGVCMLAFEVLVWALH